jgi:hypothetical protein
MTAAAAEQPTSTLAPTTQSAAAASSTVAAPSTVAASSTVAAPGSSVASVNSQLTTSTPVASSGAVLIVPPQHSAAVPIDPASVCPGAIPLSCNTSADRRTTEDGRANQWSGYDCSERLEDGREVIYSLQGTTSGPLNVIMTPLLMADLDFFMLDSCEPLKTTRCSAVAAPGASEAISLTLNAGETVFFAVDSSAGNEGNYILSVTCTEPLKPL